MKFPRQARLTTPADFRHVFAQPEVSRDAWFRILSRANGMAHSRLGLAVSRKACRSAAGRNRLKRLIRESFRVHQVELAANGGRDIVVLPNAQAASICNAKLNGSLQAHWKKIGTRSASRAGQKERNND